jgi:tetratricopeptide (TPR) repeat protein
VYRATPCMLLALCISFTALAAPSADVKDAKAKGPTVEEIQKAIEDLGSKRFAVRDRAKKWLLEVGVAAEPYLEKAAKSSDEEIASTAKGILDRFQWGLYPDTPKPVRDLIEQFRSGTAEERQEAMAGLLKLKQVPFATIRKLLVKEDNPELREQMLVRMYEQVRKSVPEFLARGDYDGVEAMFDLLLEGPPTLVGPDYATFLYLRKRLDGAIARFEKLQQKNDETGKRAAETLVYLYRCKGNWQAARKAAEKANKEELIDRVLWQSSDWKALTAAGRPQANGSFDGVAAAYDRLAGNRKGFDERIEAIRKACEAEMEDELALRIEANALMLNGKANDAIKILGDKKRELALVFDLLCAQMRHKEAFDLVDEARRRDTLPKEWHDIQVRRARMHCLLGDKDGAIQLFGAVAEAVKGPGDLFLACNLIKAEVRVAFLDLAAEHAAKCIAVLEQEGQPSKFAQLAEPIFSSDKAAAQAWWLLIRKDKPNEEPGIAMKRVRDILAGKLERAKLDEWLPKMALQTKDPVVNETPRDDQTRVQSFNALAIACRAAGDDKLAEEYLKAGAAKSDTSERWIKYGDFLFDKKRYKEARAAYAKAARPGRLGQEIDNEDELPFDKPGAALATYLQARAATLDGDAAEGKRLAELAHWLPLGSEIMRAKLVDELNKRDWPEMARKEADMLLQTGWWTDSNYTYGNVLSFLARQASKERQFMTAADYYEKCLVGCMRTGASFVEPTAYLFVPESVRVYRARGFLAQGKIDEALREANANLDVMPGNIDLAIKLVPELDRLGKKKEAEAMFAKVRDAWVKLAKDYPSSAYAHNSAAWVMAICRRDLDTALQHSRKAVELEPKVPGYLDTLAEIHFRKGDRDKALELMKKCVELDAKSGYFRKQLTRFKSEPFDSPTPDEGEEDDD